MSKRLDLQKYLDNIVTLYYEEKKNANEIAKIYECDRTSIENLLKRNNHKLRSKSEAKMKNVGLKLDLEEILKFYYVYEKSLSEIGKRVGCSKNTILRLLKHNGHKLRNNSEAQKIAFEKLHLTKKQRLSIEILMKLGWKSQTITKYTKFNVALVSQYYSKLKKEMEQEGFQPYLPYSKISDINK